MDMMMGILTQTGLDIESMVLICPDCWFQPIPSMYAIQKKTMQFYIQNGVNVHNFVSILIGHYIYIYIRHRNGVVNQQHPVNMSISIGIIIPFFCVVAGNGTPAKMGV